MKSTNRFFRDFISQLGSNSNSFEQCTCKLLNKWWALPLARSNYCIPQVFSLTDLRGDIRKFTLISYQSECHH